MSVFPWAGAPRRQAARDAGRPRQGTTAGWTILGCSDSRVPPEWVFDAGLGEFFVVPDRRRQRCLAGNRRKPTIRKHSTCKRGCLWCLATRGVGLSVPPWRRSTKAASASLADSAVGGQHPARASGIRSAAYSAGAAGPGHRRQCASDDEPDRELARGPGAPGGRLMKSPVPFMRSSPVA